MKNLNKRLRRIIKDATRREFMKKLGKESRDNIKLRTRQGYGVNEKGGKREALRKLSDPYIERRKTLKKQGKLSQKTSPRGVRGRSNLTKTGKMLDSLSYKVDGDSVEVFIKGSENQDKAKENAEMGRPFMNMTDKDIRRLTNLIKERVAWAIRRNLK